MLKLKLQYFGHLMRRVDSLEKTLMLGGIGGRRRRGRQRMRWPDGITDSMDKSEWTLVVGDGQGGLACCDSWGRKESDTTVRLIWSNWIRLCLPSRYPMCIHNVVCLNTTLLSQGCILGVTSGDERARRTHIPRGISYYPGPGRRSVSSYVFSEISPNTILTMTSQTLASFSNQRNCHILAFQITKWF